MNLDKFKEAVSADIQKQYPKVDYLVHTVARAIEKHKGLLPITTEKVGE